MVDGKVLAAPEARRAPGHLLAALTHDSATVLASGRCRHDQRAHPAGAAAGPGDLAGRVVTADALHTTPGQARYLRGRDADHVLTVKGNQPGPVTAIDRLAPEVFSPGAHHR